MEMKSMKMSAKDSQPSACMPESAEYPYGLKLYLDEACIKKLGMELPEMGKEFTLQAKVCVVSVSDNESLHGRHRSMELQIEAMALKGSA
jgi:hypothetical protein